MKLNTDLATSLTQTAHHGGEHDVIICDATSPFKICSSQFIRFAYNFINDELCAASDDQMASTRRTYIKVMLEIVSLSEDSTLSEFIRWLNVQLSSCFGFEKIMSSFCTSLLETVKDDVGNFLEVMPYLESCYEEGQLFYMRPTSVVGIHLRRVVLYLSRLSFFEFNSVYRNLKAYILADNMKCCSKFLPDDECLTQIDDDEISEEEYLIGGRKESIAYTKKQLEFLESNEVRADPPDVMNEKLNSIVCNHPDLFCAHFLAYINNLRMKRFTHALDALAKCSASIASDHHSIVFEKHLSLMFDSSNNSVPDLGSELQQQNTAFNLTSLASGGFLYRFASLKLINLHYHFQNYSLARAAVKETISIAQYNKDTLCLQYALAWLNRIGQEGDEGGNCQNDSLCSKNKILSLLDKSVVNSEAGCEGERERDTHELLSSMSLSSPYVTSDDASGADSANKMQHVNPTYCNLHFSALLQRVKHGMNMKQSDPSNVMQIWADISRAEKCASCFRNQKNRLKVFNYLHTFWSVYAGTFHPLASIHSTNLLKSSLADDESEHGNGKTMFDSMIFAVLNVSKQYFAVGKYGECERIMTLLKEWVVPSHGQILHQSIHKMIELQEVQMQFEMAILCRNDHIAGEKLLQRNLQLFQPCLIHHQRDQEKGGRCLGNVELILMKLELYITQCELKKVENILKSVNEVISDKRLNVDCLNIQHRIRLHIVESEYQMLIGQYTKSLHPLSLALNLCVNHCFSDLTALVMMYIAHVHLHLKHPSRAIHLIRWVIVQFNNKNSNGQGCHLFEGARALLLLAKCQMAIVCEGITRRSNENVVKFGVKKVVSLLNKCLVMFERLNMPSRVKHVLYLKARFFHSINSFENFVKERNVVSSEFKRLDHDNKSSMSRYLSHLP